jgi:hypothetical protein
MSFWPQSSISFLWSAILFCAGHPDALAGQWNAVQAHAGGVVDGVAKRRGGRESATFTDPFGAKGAGAASFFNDNRVK